MILKSKLYTVLAILVSISMLTQIFVVPSTNLPYGVQSVKGADSDLPHIGVPNLTSDLAQELTTLGVIGPDGQPSQFLMDTAVTQPEPLPTEPAALANPLSISRVQSQYQAGGTAVVTYTVRNNRPPSHFPNIPENATVTETAQIIADFDLTTDPNTIRDMTVANTLNSVAAYLAASPLPDRQGDTFVWNLGDIPPQADRSFSLELQLPGTAPDFLALDTGATAYGTLQGRMVSAQAAAMILAPDGFAQWLIWTPDANIYDQYMLNQVAALAQDPVLLFNTVQSFVYEAYTGSLRGTRGTLWSEAGNSVDQTSLLIAMLRSSGIPARYRHGSLSVTDAKALIQSMFPTPNQVIGHVPPEVVVSDPVNDPALIVEVQDHWWVEAYLPGIGWIDLDPSFAAAAVGDSFATPTGDGTDQIAELPESIRHQVHLTLKAEQYSQFPVSGSNLSVIYPLTATLNAVELVGLPINISFLVNTDSQSGLAYANTIHTYTPLLSLGAESEAIDGQVFSDLLTNFPLATNFTTGLWLMVETETPEGEITTYEREIKDRIGVENRVNGGLLELEPIDDAPAITGADVIQVQVVPQSHMPRSQVNRALGDVLAVSGDMGEAYTSFTSLDLEDLAASLAWINENADKLQAAQLSMLDMLGTSFYAISTDSNRQATSQTVLVKSYPDAPKLLLMSQSAISDTLNFSFELLNIRERSLAYPGQAANAVVSANMMRTMGDKSIEYELLNSLAFGPQSAYETFLTAQDNEIPLVMITAANLSDLASLTISAEAKARITKAVTAGTSVFVPAEPVNINGDLEIGWLEIDESGHSSFVNEQGQHASTITEYAMKVYVYFWSLGPAAALLGGFVLTLVLFVGNVIGVANNFLDFATGQGLSGALSDAGGKIKLELWAALAQTVSEAIPMCGAALFKVDCVAGVGVALLLLGPVVTGIMINSDPSLPDMLMDLETNGDGQQEATTAVTIPASNSANTLVVSAATDYAALLGNASLNWTDDHQHGFILSNLTANNVNLYDNGVLVDAGSLAVNDITVASLNSNGLVIDLNGDGSHSFFARPVTGLGVGTNWNNYTAVLSAGQPYTITLADATVSMNNSATYTGTLTAVVNGAAQVIGPDHSPVPQFSGSTTVQMGAAGLNVGPLNGTVLADGLSFPADNGIAVAPFNGPFTVSESSAAADLVAFSSTADFFSLSLNPATRTINPTQPVNITPILDANFTDTYTMTIAAPVGWTTHFTGSSEMTAQAPPGASPADYTLLVTAQSYQYPDLFVSAVHTVTVLPHEGVVLSIVEDLLITMPMGPVANPLATVSGPLGHIPNGQAEVPGAAYTINVTNTSTADHTFNLSVSGLPAGWTTLSNVGQATATTLDLGPGEMGLVGLYISPTVEALMAPGTSYTIDVVATAQDNPSLSQSDTILFTMPGLPFPYPRLMPEHQFVTQDDLLSVGFTVSNVGNVPGSLPITATVRASAFSGVSVSPTPITSGETWTTPVLAPGESGSQTMTITTTDMMPGQTYFILAKSAQGEYKPTAYSAFTVVSQTTGPVFEASEQMAEACTLGEPGLSASLNTLALAMSDLEQSCDAGNCSLPTRDQLVSTLNGVVYYADGVSSQITADNSLQTIAAEMSNHTNGTDLLADLDAVNVAVADLTDEVCELSLYLPSVDWVPTYSAALAGDTLTYSLELKNLGSLTATFALTVSLPSGTSMSNIELTPDEIATFDYPITETTLGMYQLTAEAVVSGITTDIRAIDAAQLNVVDKFVQVTAVTADPPFVESGSSATNLSLDITNVANLSQPATARTTILAPGDEISYTADIPLTILAGSPIRYELATVDTSGWAVGIYTITVDLLDENDSPLSDGSGFGSFVVGQGMGVIHGVQPTLVAPGMVTVTTMITSEVLVSVIPTATLPAGLAPQWQITGLRQIHPITAEVSIQGETAVDVVEEIPSSVSVQPDPRSESKSSLLPPDANFLTTHGTVIVRHEEDDPGIVYSGSWVNFNDTQASSGSYLRSNAVGASTSFDFNGDWVGLGFVASNNDGQAEVFIDGISQGIIDLYSWDKQVRSFYYNDLVSATHTISVTVLGSSNPNAGNSYVRFDFIDTWDGMLLTDGTFEAGLGSDERIFLSGGWSNITNAAASDGAYLRGSSNTAWFPFTSDSVTYQALAYAGGGKVKVYIDGRFQTTFDLYSPTAMTRTLSFDNLGPGPHVLHVNSYRDFSTIDTFTTPGSGPFFTPPTPTGVIRYEEDKLAILYNGVAYTQTAISWSERTSNLASEGYYFRSDTPGDTAVLSFNNTWVGVGFIGGLNSGMAEIFIDGVSQGAVDLYRRETQPVSVYYDGLISATHTLSVTVTGSQHPYAGGGQVNLDFIDTWDGLPLADGPFEAELGNDERIFLSRGWNNVTNAAANDGAYLRGTSNTAWFPFTGDSETYQALAYANGGKVKVYIDGRFQTVFDLYSLAAVTRTLSFDNLGSGPHIMQVSSYLGYSTIDTFSTPGSGPFYTPPTPTGVVRYEEDVPAILYNNMPFTQTTSSWEARIMPRASHGYAARSNTLSDTISLTFDGTWVSLGFTTDSSSGLAKIMIDGIVQETIDLYSPAPDVTSLFYRGLITGTHTISVTVLDQSHPDSSNSYVFLDYIDIWDGTMMAAGWYEADPVYLDNNRVDMSTDWRDQSDVNAGDDLYFDNGSNAWFRFTGDDVTLLALTDTNINSSAEILIDGVSQGVSDLTYDFTNSPLPLHFTSLGTGPHVIQMKGLDRAAIDAFEANPTIFHPGVPLVEWYDFTPGSLNGVIATAAAGDVNGDGQVEIAISSDTGELYLFTGDGRDAGGSSPIIWSQTVGNEPDAPVLVELDGNPGVEIVVGSMNGIHAFHSDGSQYWLNDTIQTNFPAGGASVGNLDNDAETELVVAANGILAVLEADGALSWQFGMNGQASPPVLADLTGDGYLDIFILEEGSGTAYLLDYNQGISPTIAWTHVFTSALVGLRGAPAVANIDGQQPGGDSSPEVIVATNGFVNVLDADGTPLWKTAIGAGAPGGISVADTDGDGEVEIITSAQFDGGRIYVLNADGSILWDGPALDNTSGTSAVAHDLDGNGRWEVIWNGDGQGLTIYDGIDGTILFNEPIVNSITRKDFPIVVDVDGDGHAEIVAGDPAGIYVIGYDTVWDESRDLWNQYNYHVTNINDDLTTPPTEPNSWQVHNTYRTQTPLNDVLAVYGVDITHTVGISGVMVLTDTLPVPVDITAPQYHWGYIQYWYQLVHNSRFDALVTNMRPGEVRQVSQETVFNYTLPSGANRLTLPPLFITADHIINLIPASRSMGAGGTAVYDVVLSNPATVEDTYALAQVGLPSDWVTLPATVTMGAGAQLTVPLSIVVPASVDMGDLDFVVTVTNGDGATDMAGGELAIIDLLDIAIQPEIQNVINSQAVTYTLTLSNVDFITHTYDLTAVGLAGVTLPLSVTVPAADLSAPGVVVLPITVSSSASGSNPFTIIAADKMVAASDSAVLNVAGNRYVDLVLYPDTKQGGPGIPTVFTTTVSNLGMVVDTYDLDLSLPTGWDHSLNTNGTPVSNVSLTADLFNTTDLQLIVMPPVGTMPGNYEFGIAAQSQDDPNVTAAVTGTVQVQSRGVGIHISPLNSTLDPNETGIWQVTITNTGSVADSYWLTSTGIVALSGQFSINPVALNPGQATTVQLMADVFEYALPTTYQFAVGAESQSDSLVRNEVVAQVSFNQYEDVEVAWIPVSETVTDTLSAAFVMIITNTGNVGATYHFDLNTPGLSSQLSVNQLDILPHIELGVLVTVEASAAGLYTIEGEATSTSGLASDSSIATLEIIFTNEPPTAVAGNDETTDEAQEINFSGAANDPEGGPLDILWDFGDGVTFSGSLTPTQYICR